MSIDLKKIKAQETKTEQLNYSLEFLNWLKKDIKFNSLKLSEKKKERFYTELGILLSSGMDIKTSLEIILEQFKNKREAKLFYRINKDVIEGCSLSDALLQTGRFSKFEYYSIKIGEESGRLNEVLKELTNYYSRKIKQKRQLVNAFTYPCLVLFTAFAAVWFMMGFVVPLFEDVFNRFQGELPPVTRFIINLSESFSNNIGKLFLIVLVFGLVVFSLRKKNWFRNLKAKALLIIPLSGEIVRKVYLARFCQTMALLFSSKTPMLRSIQLVKEMIGFYPFEIALKQIEIDILYGKNLHQSMRKYSIFDSRIIALTKVAEEVNQLDTVYKRLNQQYSEELEHRINMLSNLLEPMMIIFVGILVAIILISMYLPLFQISTSFV